MGNAITVPELQTMLDGPRPPVLIDVRREKAFAASRRVIGSAIRVPPEGIADAASRFTGIVVVYCAHGHEVGRNACEVLRNAGVETFYLEGGFEGWCNAVRPVEPYEKGIRA